MKKKYRLKKWVKVVLVCIPLAIMLSIIFPILEKMDKQFMDNCLADNNTYDYCEYELNKSKR